jgi:membrane-associated HD superfamily phosphohydrolase
VLAKKLGLEASVLFADLAGSQLYWDSQNKTDNEGWFFRTQKDIEDQTTLSPKVQTKCIKILIENGLVQTKLKGLPAVTHYLIGEHEVTNLLNLFSQKGESSLAKREKLVSTKGSTIKNINNKNINNENIIIEDSFSKKEPKKVLDKKDNTTFIFSNDITSDLINSITSYFEYRKEIKKPFKSQKAIDAKISQFTQQAKEYGEQAVIQSISNSIANQYQGTFIDKQFLNKSQTQLIDDKGNYQKSDAGRKQFITDVTEGAVEAIRELRNRERDDYWVR